MEPLAVMIGAEIEIGSASEKIEIRRNLLIAECILFLFEMPTNEFRQHLATDVGLRHHRSRRYTETLARRNRAERQHKGRFALRMLLN